jgi:hypothetical protein
MHPMERLEATERVLGGVTLGDVNAIARELCEHLSHMDAEQVGVDVEARLGCG